MTEEKKEPKREESKTDEGKKLGRRDFLQGLSTLPVLGLFGAAVVQQARFDKKQKTKAAGTAKPRTGGVSDLNVALLGTGAQGEVLLNAMLKIPGLRFRAVCDIWTEYNQKKTVNLLRKYKHSPNAYENHEDMLVREKDLDAVVIATPDFWHGRHAVDCMKAGLHVYCEKEMSNTLEDARRMVIASRETKRLLQIGHQRRSNPRYIHCRERILGEAGMIGRVATVGGQWNRSAQPDLGWPARYAMPADRLKRYGFQSMAQFRNWRWYKGLGGGPIVDLGSHQIDIYNWFLGARPVAVTANGGIDYYPASTHEWYDTVMAVYEYETPAGRTRAFYQTQTTNSSQGYFENFMGDAGTLLISESANRGAVYREPSAPAWDEWVRRGIVTAPVLADDPAADSAGASAVLDVRETVSPEKYGLPVEFTDPYHKPHLENFFDAVRGNAVLNCPGEAGYECAVTVLKVNASVEAARRLTFDPKEFEV